MLSKNLKVVIDFIEECRGQKMMQDELFLKSEEMWAAIFQPEKVMRRTTEDRKLFLKLETLIAETINLTKETYFEYGENFEATQMSRIIEKVKEEAM